MVKKRKFNSDFTQFYSLVDIIIIVDFSAIIKKIIVIKTVIILFLKSYTDSPLRNILINYYIFIINKKIRINQGIFFTCKVYNLILLRHPLSVLLLKKPGMSDFIFQ